MKISKRSLMGSCSMIVLGIVLLFFILYFGEKFLVKKPTFVSLENKSDQFAFAASDGSIWLASLEDKTVVNILPKMGEKTLSFLLWSNSRNQLLVTRCPNECPYDAGYSFTENLYISLIDFDTRKIYENILSTQNMPTSYYIGIEQEQKYINLCSEQPHIRYFLESGKIYNLSDDAPCDERETAVIPESVLPEGFFRQHFQKTPSNPNWYFSSNLERTFIYDTVAQVEINSYNNWLIECWKNPEFFIASKRQDTNHARGIYKVNLDGSFKLLVSGIKEYTKEHLWRSPFCSPDTNRIYYWESSKASNDWRTNLYMVQTETLESQIIWSLNGFYGGSYNEYLIQSTNNFSIYVPINMLGDGFLMLLKGDESEVLPIAGSNEEMSNINNISSVRFFGEFSTSPNGKWIIFVGSSGSEAERSYIIDNNGTHLTLLAGEKIASTVTCGDWSPSSNYIMCKCSEVENETNVYACFVDTNGALVFEVKDARFYTQNSVAWRP